jgi:hypothetical protein
MKLHLHILIVTTILAGLMVVSLRADNYLTNADLKDGVAGWHGDGQATFLKPDGTEGADGDPGVIPVIKVTLSSGESHFVYQEISTRDKPTAMHVKVEVFASSDFQRSTHADDYTIQWKPGGTWYWSAIAVPSVDFWIRGGSSNSWFYKLSNLKPGTWTTVDGHFEGLPTDEDRVISFDVPPGHGTIYFKNPVAEAQ